MASTANWAQRLLSGTLTDQRQLHGVADPNSAPPHPAAAVPIVAAVAVIGRGLWGGIGRLADLVGGSLLLVAAGAVDSLSGVHQRLRPKSRATRAVFAWLLIVLALSVAGVGIYAAAWRWRSLLVEFWPWLTAGLVPVFALGVWWLWWRLPQREADRRSAAITDAKARADVEDNFRKTIGQLLVGAAVLVGAGFVYLQLSHQQEIAREQLATSVQRIEQQQRSVHDLLVSNQVAKGFELLGNKDNQPQQRLGGIYALEAVMNDKNSKQYHQPILEALSALVRDSSTKSAPSVGRDGRAPTERKSARTRGVTKPDPQGVLPLPNDVHGALTVIGRRDTSLSDVVPDLQDVRFPNADLSKLKLIKVNLGRADLSGAYLTGANLSGAVLDGADLRGTILDGAQLSDADLHGAYLTGASLSGANLSRANLTNAFLTGVADLSQEQLDQACGSQVKLDHGLYLDRPCAPLGPPGPVPSGQ